MKSRISTEECFIGHLIGQRPCKKGFLDQVDKLIDWKPMAKFIDKHCKKAKKRGRACLCVYARRQADVLSVFTSFQNASHSALV